jgi:hypothetical protein
LRTALDPGLLAVTATASYDQSVHGPASALDGDRNTEWLLPTGTLGTLEIKLKPQRVRHVRVRNASNGSYADRATHDFHIELWREGKLLLKAPGTFPRFETAPGWTAVATDARAKVDTLKFVVDSYHKSGGGLAEISWD